MVKNKVKDMRMKKGISLYRLAKDSGLAYRNLWDVEHGSDVKLSTLYKIAEVLECNVSDLVE